MERDKRLKEEQEGMINVLKNVHETESEVEDMTDDELNRHI